MPLVKQKSQLNDNLSLNFFYGNNGIPVYPSYRCGSDCLKDEYFSAFPKHSLLAIGVHGFVGRKYEKHEWRFWIKQIIDVLMPSGIIVVGHLNRDLVEEFSARTPFYCYDSFIEEREKEVKNNVY